MTAARRTALAFLALVLVCALHDLGGRSLHELDTGRWGQLAREMLRSGSWLVPTRYGEIYANKPPLYLWLVAGPSALVGEVTPFLVRLPSALGLIALVLVSTWWTRLRSGSAQAGYVAGLLVLSTFLVAWQGREGRLDMMGSALSFAAAALLDRQALGRGTRGGPWLAGLLVGLALLTKGPPLLLVPVFVLLVPSEGRSIRERVKAARPLLVLGIGAAVALLWFVPAVIAGGEDYGRALLFKQAADRVSGRGNYIEPFWHYFLTLPATAAPWGIAYLGVFVAALVPRWRRSLGSLAGIALAGSLVLLVFSLFPTKHYRYLSPVVPLFAMGLAWWIHRWLEGPARARWAGHVRALSVVLALGGVACIVLGALKSGGWFAGLVPGLLLLATAGACARVLREPDGDARGQRRRWVLCLLVAACVGMLAQAAIRPHWYVTDKEAFNRQLAAATPAGATVLLAEPLRPEGVFHGAPHARFGWFPDTPLPADLHGRVVLVCTEPDRAKALEALRKRGVAGEDVEATPPDDYGQVILNALLP